MQKSNQVGKLICYERTKASMTVGQLCKGICSRTMLMRVESGERECEKIVADALLQRAGVSADKFVYSMDNQEQEWLILREKIIDVIERKQYQKANDYIQEYKTVTSKKSKLHQQLIILFQIVIEWKKGNISEELIKKIHTAWSITMPNSKTSCVRNNNLTITEFILLMMKYRILQELGKEEYASRGYGELLHYMENYYDEEDRVKLYPQIAYQRAQILIKDRQFYKAVILAKKSIMLLKIRGRIFYLRPFLEIIEAYDIIDSNHKKEISTICNSIMWLYKKYHVEEKTWNWNVSFGMAEVELCSDVIKKCRKAMKLSQEELSAEICDPVTISRIECKKTSPQKDVFNSIMKRLGKGGNNFETTLQIERPDLLTKAISISILLSHSRGNEAEILIKELGDNLINKNKSINQFLLYTKALALFNQKKILPSQLVDIEKKALKITLPNLQSNFISNWCLTRHEINIINSNFAHRF